MTWRNGPTRIEESKNLLDNLLGRVSGLRQVARSGSVFNVDSNLVEWLEWGEETHALELPHFPKFDRDCIDFIHSYVRECVCAAKRTLLVLPQEVRCKLMMDGRRWIIIITDHRQMHAYKVTGTLFHELEWRSSTSSMTAMWWASCVYTVRCTWFTLMVNYNFSTRHRQMIIVRWHWNHCRRSGNGSTIQVHFELGMSVAASNLTQSSSHGINLTSTTFHIHSRSRYIAVN